MDKKGAELSMNVVIIAIIAVLVLVVVAIVFTGGVANAVGTMREFFNIGTKGTNLQFVEEQCKFACDNAKLSNNPSRSSYCTSVFDVKVDNEIKKYGCWSRQDVTGVNVGCNVQCTG